MLAGVRAAGFVSWSQVSETWPESPPGATATATTAPTTTTASAASRLRPASTRTRGEGGQRALAKPTTRPAASSVTAISTSSAPSEWPSWVRDARSTRSFVSASRENAHAITGAARRLVQSSATAARSRSGTTSSHTAIPASRASSAPRE